MLASDFFEVPRLRINGDKPPLQLHGYMEWKGTTLLLPFLCLALLIIQFLLSCAFNLFSTSPEEAL